MRRNYSKYRAKKTIVDGITFDSKGEANRYKYLLLLEKSGTISNLELQPIYLLQDKFKVGAETIRAIKYVADFRYIENNSVVVEDFKGMETVLFKIKRKLLLYKFKSIDFRVIK